MGSGVIYPIPISDVEVKAVRHPVWLEERLCARRRLEPHGRAVGRAEPGRRHDLPATSEHYKGQQLPVVHAAAIKTRGEWIQRSN